jgi:hypothetical protein
MKTSNVLRRVYGVTPALIGVLYFFFIIVGVFACDSRLPVWPYSYSVLLSAARSQPVVFMSTGRKREHEFVRARVRVAEEHQRACVGQMCVAAQVADDVRGEKPNFRVINRQEFDRAEPVRLILPVWLQNILAIRSKDRQIFPC